jgi:hypothetical protein
LVAAWATNYLQMHPDVAAGIEAAGVNILLQQATLQRDQTAQSILANPIGVIGCNLWGELGNAVAAALAEPEVRIIPRRPGLPQRADGGLERGQLTDDEFHFFRRLAMARRNQGRTDPIVLTGSMSETDLGFLSRYDKNLQSHLPDFRKNKPASGLVETGVGDLDFWQGSKLDDAELAAIYKRFPGWEVDAIGYGRSKGYNTIGDFAKDAGAIVFQVDGTTERVLGAWQRENWPP